MPRKKTKSLIRPIQPDRKYDSVLVQRLINRSMVDGKKAAAESAVYKAMEQAAKKVKVEDPLEVLETALGAKVGLIGTMGALVGDEHIHSERTTPESFELQGLFAKMRDAGCTHVVMEVSSHALTLDRVGGIHFNNSINASLELTITIGTSF